VVLPVTTLENITSGFPLDIVLYANNYEPVDENHPVIEPLSSAASALDVFRSGAVMSKGTTTTSGLVHTYFANVFGPHQYPDLHDRIAQRFFAAFFDQNIIVAQLRTQLGVPGLERSGPDVAASALLTLLAKR
jgi:hypothetical protein